MGCTSQKGGTMSWFLYIAFTGVMAFNCYSLVNIGIDYMAGYDWNSVALLHLLSAVCCSFVVMLIESLNPHLPQVSRETLNNAVIVAY